MKKLTRLSLERLLPVKAVLKIPNTRRSRQKNDRPSKSLTRTQRARKRALRAGLMTPAMAPRRNPKTTARMIQRITQRMDRIVRLKTPRKGASCLTMATNYQAPMLQVKSTSLDRVRVLVSSRRDLDLRQSCKARKT